MVAGLDPSMGCGRATGTGRTLGAGRTAFAHPLQTTDRPTTTARRDQGERASTAGHGGWLPPRWIEGSSAAGAAVDGLEDRALAAAARAKLEWGGGSSCSALFGLGCRCRASRPPVQSAVNRGRAAYDGTQPKRPDQCFGVDIWGMGIDWVTRLFRFACAGHGPGAPFDFGVLGGGVTGAAQTCFCLFAWTLGQEPLPPPHRMMRIPRDVLPDIDLTSLQPSRHPTTRQGPRIVAARIGTPPTARPTEAS